MILRTTFAAVLATLALASTCFAQGTLYTCRSGRELFSIDPATGALTALGNISAGVNTSASLAYDCASQITYVSQSFANVGVQRNLWRLNLPSPVATLVGPFGDTALIVHGIEIDSRTGNLYGISSHNRGLYNIDKATGQATLIGLTGITGSFPFPQLLFDSDRCVMYTTSSETDSLYTVDLQTGAATLVGPFNVSGTFSALTYAHDTDTAYMIENSTATPQLFTVDLLTGNATFVATLTGGQNLIGLVYVPNTCPSPCSSFTAFCFGDGTGTACPCGNNGAAGNGCSNSVFAQGANLAGAGTASISADTVVLTTTSTPNSSVLFFQGTAQQSGGSGVVFGDGKRCAAGSVIRLGTKTALGGSAQYPVGPDLSISVRGLVTAPGVRTYQGWYRNAAAFCTVSTFNLTNGCEITWGA